MTKTSGVQIAEYLRGLANQIGEHEGSELTRLDLDDAGWLEAGAKEIELLYEHIGKMGNLPPGAWRDLLKQVVLPDEPTVTHVSLIENPPDPLCIMEKSSEPRDGVSYQFIVEGARSVEVPYIPLDATDEEATRICEAAGLKYGGRKMVPLNREAHKTEWERAKEGQNKPPELD